MTDRAPWEQEPPAPPPPASTVNAGAENAAVRAEKAEAAAIRRRWITLGELLAVLALGISALTLWNSWSERTHAEAEKSADEAKAGAKAMTLVLRATLSRDRRVLALAPADTGQTIQSQTILYPAALGLTPNESTGDARIDARWFDDAVRKSDPPHGKALRLPVAITTRFVNEEGTIGDATALYHVGYRVEGRLLGSAVELTGLSLIGRVPAKDAQKRLDAVKG